MTNGFPLNHDKSLQIYFFCVKRQGKKDFLKEVKIDFLKDVENTVNAIITPNIQILPKHTYPKV